ncbi:hypothetical protein [Halapricum hydrolyticum]|uniref:Uncharacterized protein n=1 Tax=Halapricum hydrolyticum TaxID=2979991 RepID=A0AAE3IEF4_9EURY|nr:hypothetical protein [Halapricum hydrolyticum]MCU4719517.1 hypothetical protein [Halapricum hydrolyticum]MCU4728199.1 hypothetical protein [Halapricum hydrolyticum]
MATDSSGDGDVQVEITKCGITITLRDKLDWKIEQNWDEISKIQIDTTEKDLIPSDSSENNLPITIKSADITIRDIGDDTDTSTQSGEQKSVEGQKMSGESEEIQMGDEIAVPNYWNSIQEETGIQYDPSTETVKFPEDKTLTEIFSDFIRFLFSNGHMAKSDLPWATPNARTNYVLNSQPVHKDGEEMDAVEVIDGVFFDKKIPRNQRKRHVQRLVEEFVKE